MSTVTQPCMRAQIRVFACRNLVLVQLYDMKKKAEVFQDLVLWNYDTY